MYAVPKPCKAQASSLMPLEVLLRSTRVSTLQEYHGASASPVMHTLTARQLLVVARERCRSCARDGKKECCAGGLAGWRVGRETAPMAVSAVESGIDDRTRIPPPGIMRPHETKGRVKASRNRLAIAMGAVSRPTRPHSCCQDDAPLHVFARRRGTRIPRTRDGTAAKPQMTLDRAPETRRPTSKTRRPKRSRLPKPRFCCTRRAERAERSGPKPISIPAPFMRVRPSAWLWHSDFDTNFDPRALHEGATSSFGSAALSQSNFNPRTLHGGVTPANRRKNRNKPFQSPHPAWGCDRNDYDIEKETSTISCIPCKQPTALSQPRRSNRSRIGCEPPASIMFAFDSHSVEFAASSAAAFRKEGPAVIMTATKRASPEQKSPTLDALLDHRPSQSLPRNQRAGKTPTNKRARRSASVHNIERRRFLCKFGR